MKVKGTYPQPLPEGRGVKSKAKVGDGIELGGGNRRKNSGRLDGTLRRELWGVFFG